MCPFEPGCSGAELVGFAGRQKARRVTLSRAIGHMSYQLSDHALRYNLSLEIFTFLQLECPK